MGYMDSLLEIFYVGYWHMNIYGLWKNLNLWTKWICLKILRFRFQATLISPLIACKMRKAVFAQWRLFIRAWMIPIGCGHFEPCPLTTMFVQAALVGSTVGPSKYSRYIQELTSAQQYLIQSTNTVLNHGPTDRTTKSIVSKTSPIKVSVAYCIFSLNSVDGRFGQLWLPASDILDLGGSCRWFCARLWLSVRLCF